MVIVRLLINLFQFHLKMLSPEGSKVNNFEEISKALPGEYSFYSNGSTSVRRYIEPKNSDKVVLIYFLGGCTFSELAVLRRFASQKGYHFIFATTSFFNSNFVLDSFH
jgi:vacuolar protein sorting-associated protein 33B